MKYYRTSSGYCYKQYANGKSVRVSDTEYSQQGGATTTTTTTKSKSPPKLSAKDQKCVDLAQDIIANNKQLWIKDGKKDRTKFKHVAALVAVSYDEARKKYPECVTFYDSNKKLRDAAKADRKANKKKSTSRKKSKSKSKSKSK